MDHDNSGFSLLKNKNAPQRLPDTVLSTRLQSQISLRMLQDNSLTSWFEPLPIEIWADFFGNDSIMTDGQPEDHEWRVQILTILHQTYQRKYGQERAVFGSFIKSPLADKPSVPFDVGGGCSNSGKATNNTKPIKNAARPADMYL